jgi:ABC-type branched-subunit amino acid transport system substrate-binding protein
LSWFSEYGVESIDEIKLIYEDQDEEDMIPEFSTIVAQALKSGADVSILADVEPELLGFFDE